MLDLISIGLCALIWGTTWYGITLQLGMVDPIVSVAYRFALASVLLFAWGAVRGEPLGLTRRQHLAAFGVGLCTFTIDYACVYLAEERVASAVVAVVFGATAFINLLAFRLLFRQSAARGAWIGAGLGVLGVALLSWEELVQARVDAGVVSGLALAFVAVLMAVLGNASARRGEQLGAPIAASTAWAMGYGAVLLAIFVTVSGRPWRFDPSARYALSLTYLSVLGSVVAFLLYFGVARRRGYTLAAYITALTPLIAMLMSSRFESKHWGVPALMGVALVVVGQWLLMRARNVAAPVGRREPVYVRSAAPDSAR